MAIDFMSTVKGSYCEGFLPEGWDLKDFDKAASQPPQTITKRKPWWHRKFQPVPCKTLADFETMMGHEIALHILRAKEAGKQIVFILPVGPMGMYRWTVYFLQQWGVDAKHVHGFNMDEWSDEKGNTVPASSSQSFQYAMEDAFYGPLGKLTVPKKQRHFATKSALPKYAEKIGALRKKGAPLVVVFGIGRVCHIAFWEPHFAAEYGSVKEWKKPTHRIGARLHPLTVEQNAITSFKSRTTLVSCYANTIGPGLFLGADAIVGGADGALGRGMMWQGMSLCATLRLKPTPWVPSTFMPTQPGKLFFLEELAGPLEPECN
jgi:glucosamine-6-phosphate deaminase